MLIDATKQLSSLDGQKEDAVSPFVHSFDRAVMGKSRLLRRRRRGAPSIPVRAYPGRQAIPGPTTPSQPAVFTSKSFKLFNSRLGSDCCPNGNY